MTRLVNSTKGLNANKRGLLEADETGHTSRPGIFASGDVVNGARTVVEGLWHIVRLLQNLCMNICSRLKILQTNTHCFTIVIQYMTLINALAK